MTTMNTPICYKFETKISLSILFLSLPRSSSLRLSSTRRTWGAEPMHLPRPQGPTPRPPRRRWHSRAAGRPVPAPRTRSAAELGLKRLDMCAPHRIIGPGREHTDGHLTFFVRILRGNSQPMRRRWAISSGRQPWASRAPASTPARSSTGIAWSAARLAARCSAFCP